MLIYRLFSNPIKEKIFKSPYFKEIRTYDLNQTITEAQQLSSIGSLVYGSPHQFICLLQKLESLNIGDSIILEKYHEALKGDNSSFVMFFVFYIRMTVRMKGDFEVIRRNLCSDESLINIIDENNEHYTITIKEMLNMLQNDRYVLGVFMKNV